MRPDPRQYRNATQGSPTVPERHPGIPDSTGTPPRDPRQYRNATPGAPTVPERHPGIPDSTGTPPRDPRQYRNATQGSPTVPERHPGISDSTGTPPRDPRQYRNATQGSPTVPERHPRISDSTGTPPREPRQYRNATQGAPTVPERHPGIPDSTGTPPREPRQYRNATQGSPTVPERHPGIPDSTGTPPREPRQYRNATPENTHRTVNNVKGVEGGGIPLEEGRQTPFFNTNLKSRPPWPPSPDSTSLTRPHRGPTGGYQRGSNLTPHPCSATSTATTSLLILNLLHSFLTISEPHPGSFPPLLRHQHRQTRRFHNARRGDANPPLERQPETPPETRGNPSPLEAPQVDQPHQTRSPKQKGTPSGAPPPPS
nr:basic salivary proline-rich protein 3-like [Procambarus clarkii]